MDVDAEPGAAVLRIDVDVNGDGRTDLLLANGARLGKGDVGDWLVYIALDEVRHRFAGSVPLSPSTFRVLPTGRLSVLSFGAAEDSGRQGELVTYQIGDAGITESARRASGEPEIAEELKSIQAWRRDRGLRVLVGQVDPDGRFRGVPWKEQGSAKPAPDARTLEGMLVIG